MTVNLELVNVAPQVSAAGAVTAQTLGLPLVSKAMPAPCSVMMIPAWVPALMAPVGVNVKVAVVAVALTEDVSVIARLLMAAQWTADTRIAKMARARVIVAIWGHS